MPDLPARPDLDQLRHQAKDLLRAAQRGDSGAAARIGAVSDRLILSSAQLALAREYGFASWARLKLEVERRDVLNSRDLSRLTRLLAEHPELATRPMEHWADRQHGEPLGYITKMRFNHDRLGLPRDLTGTGAIARALIDAGAPVDGHPGDKETPLITAASYGDAEVAKVLADAGADIDAVSAPDSGGVPSGTALDHAAVFGMTDVVDVLVAAGARIDSLEMAAAAGDITGWPLARFTLESRIRALVFAADHQRLERHRPARPGRDPGQPGRRRVGAAATAHRGGQRPGRQRQAAARPRRRPRSARPPAPPHPAGGMPASRQSGTPRGRVHPPAPDPQRHARDSALTHQAG